MGKRCDLKVDHGAFWRRFAGEQSPEDLETTMQLIYRLFTTSPEPVREELNTYIQCAQASLLQWPIAYFDLLCIGPGPSHCSLGVCMRHAARVVLTSAEGDVRHTGHQHVSSAQYTAQRLSGQSCLQEPAGHAGGAAAQPGAALCVARAPGLPH